MDTADNLTWRKSTYSGGSGSSECVEAGNSNGEILIRDTANRDGEALEFSARAWTTFTHNLK